MVFVTFVSVRHTSTSSWMIQPYGSMISVLLKELEIGYRDPKSAGDLSVALYCSSDLCSSYGVSDRCSLFAATGR